MSTRMPGDEPPQPSHVYKRRAYIAVLAEAFIKTTGEELELENHPNGSAGITILGRAIRMGVKTLGNFYQINSRNIAAIPGAKWGPYL